MKKFVFMLFILFGCMQVFCEEIKFIYDVYNSEEKRVEKILIDKTYLIGINENKHLLSYICVKNSTTRSDKRYSYIIYDYKENKTVELLDKTWISSLYGEDYIRDWDDEKYSVSAYRNNINKLIIESYKEYQLRDFQSNKVYFSENEIMITEREDGVGWYENVNISINLIINKIQYNKNQQIDDVIMIQDIKIVDVLDLSDYYLLVTEITHVGPEHDIFEDYYLIGVEK